MNQETIVYIESVTQAIRHEYNLKTPIQDFDKFVELIGGSIEYCSVGDCFSVSVKKIDNKSFMICIPKNMSIGSQSYAILYGLGHLFLHMGFRTDKNCWDSQKIGVYRLFNTTAQLYQVIQFTHSFLMPLEEYMQTINKYSNIDNFVNIDLVAKQFKVTSTDVLNRGKFLGYF